MNIASIKPLALAVALVFAAGTACAGDPGQDGMSDSQVRDALTAGGVDYDLYMDPQTAEVVARKRD